MVYFYEYVTLINHDYGTFIKNVLDFDAKIRLNYANNFNFLHYCLIKFKNVHYSDLFLILYVHGYFSHFLYLSKYLCLYFYL